MKLKRNQLILVLLVSFIVLLLATNLSYGDDDEDDEDDEDDNGLKFIEGDTAKDIGYVSLGLYAASMLNVIVLYTFKLTRRFLDDEGKSGRVKNFTREFYLKTRKPLNWFHYLSTLGATTIIILHGLRFLGKEEEMGIIGWITTGLFLLYIVTGVIIKLKIKPLWNAKLARRILNLVHRNLIIFLGIIVLHLAHFLIAD